MINPSIRQVVVEDWVRQLEELADGARCQRRAGDRGARELAEQDAETALKTVKLKPPLTLAAIEQNEPETDPGQAESEKTKSRRPPNEAAEQNCPG